MRAPKIYWLIASLLWGRTASSESLVIHEERGEPLRKVVSRQRIESTAMLPMRIGLQQNSEALERAESWLMAVSDPDSPDYGRHWRQEDVVEAFKASDENVRTVEEWLASHGVVRTTLSDNGLWIAFDLPAEKAEKMLQTEYFEHQRAGGGFEVSTDRYFLPSHLKAHVDYIKPGVKGSDITGRTKRSREFFSNGGHDQRKTKRCKHCSEAIPTEPG